MKVLIVANFNPGKFSPFVTEQVDSIKKLGIEFDFYGVIGKGAIGYLKNLPALKHKIAKYKPDLIHAHYGLSGLLANIQRSVPVVTTFHGSDIHEGILNLLLSRFAANLSKKNIFVANHLKLMARSPKNSVVIPCGADNEIFYPITKQEARNELGWTQEDKIVVFAGAFDREVKNPNLAIDAINKLHGVRLIELKGYSRTEVNKLLNAADCLLMTSHREGSPQIIKEAMLVNLPIVTVAVGDVNDTLNGAYNCTVAQPDSDSLATAILNILSNPTRTNGRELIKQKGLTVNQVAQRVKKVYDSVLKPA